MRPHPEPRKRTPTTPAVSGAPVLYRPAQIAEILGCSEWWVKEQARRRRIPFSRLGGSYRFTADHLTEIIHIFEERPAAGTSPASDVLPSARSAHRATRATTAGSRLTARSPRRERTAKSRSAAEHGGTKEDTRIGIRREAR